MSGVIPFEIGRLPFDASGKGKGKGKGKGRRSGQERPGTSGTDATSPVESGVIPFEIGRLEFDSSGKGKIGGMKCSALMFL